MKKYFLKSFFLIFFPTLGFSQQLWSELNLTAPLLKHTEMQVTGQRRTSLHDFSYKTSFLLLGLKQEISDHLSIGISTRKYFNPEGESRYIGDLNTRIGNDTNKLNLNTRFRYQHSIFKSDKKPEDIGRVNFQLRYKLTNKANPFIEVEPFYNVQKKAISRARFAMGVQVAFRRHLRTEIFYRIEKNILKQEALLEPTIGIGLTYKFKTKKKDKAIELPTITN